MRDTTQKFCRRQDSPRTTVPGSPELALILAALLACAAAMFLVGPTAASAQDASDRPGEPQERGRFDRTESSNRAGNALGVIVDIPKGWPFDGGNDIVRFEKCFPFCDVERPGGGSSRDAPGEGDGGETETERTTNEQTTIVEQTNITEETRTGEGGPTGLTGVPTGGKAEEDDQGGAQKGEPTVSDETTLVEPTTPFPTLAGGPQGDMAGCPIGPSGPISEVTLTEVLDADTLQVKGSDDNLYTIRLIGAEAPDLDGGGAEGGQDEPGADEATTFAGEVLGGKGQKLDLEYDRRKTDENGLTFAYVWKQGDAERPEPERTQTPGAPTPSGPTLFNSELIEGGYARAATAAPNTDYARCLKRAEEAARTAATGLWSEQASSRAPGPTSGAPAGAAASDGPAAFVFVELVSRKDPLSKSDSAPEAHARANALAKARANAQNPAIPPITGHANAPESAAARASHPGPAIGLVASLVAASLAAAVGLRGGGRWTTAPAGSGPTPGGND